MTADKRNLAESIEPEGHKKLTSHVQGEPPVYGEPNGPTPGALFDHSAKAPPPDRERAGFIGGKRVVSKGDQVGSGPEGWEHASRDLSGDERNTKPAAADDTAAND